MSNTLEFTYHFKHKSGRYIIAQTSSEFFHMQGHPSKYVPLYLRNNAKGEFERDHWGGQQVRLGFKPIKLGKANGDQYAFEEKLNKFWSAAKGYEKLFPTNLTSKFSSSKLYTGYFGCQFRRFCAEVANHANMQGDMQTYKKAETMLKWYQGNMLCLPSPR